MVDDGCIVDKSPNLDCFDLCRTHDTFQLKVYGIKIAFHNATEKKDTYCIWSNGRLVINMY